MISRKRKEMTVEEELEFLRKRNAELKELVYIDPLTGVYNYRYFKDRLNQEIVRARRYKTDVALLMIDIDDFKKCNDSYGHLEGDCLLTEVAKVIKKRSRRTDIVCRYGGDEFAIILPQTGLKDARNFGEKIKQSVGKLQLRCEPTISIGIADIEQSQNIVDLISKADQALYVSKKAGKNRISDLLSENKKER